LIIKHLKAIIGFLEYTHLNSRKSNVIYILWFSVELYYVTI